MSDNLLSEINEKLKVFNASIIHTYVETALEPESGALIDDLPINFKLKEALKRRGIKRLYRFQEEAFNRISKNENVIIISGTGTGKTEAFLIPLLNKALEGERSVLVYPTKALARDQLARIKAFADEIGVKVAVLDGDTPKEERDEIYDNPPEVLITNPDMIHISLPLSKRFRDLIRSVDHLVFDEIHVYEGVLGAHLRMIIDRLRDFKRNINIIGSSATIGFSQFLFQELFGEDGVVIQGTKRRRGIAIHSLIDTAGGSRWVLSAYLAYVLVKMGLKPLIFVDSQQLAELIAKRAERFGIDLPVHRAGLPAKERHKIEEGLRSGRLDGVVATPTLELGIDIGSLDAVIMAEQPPSYSKYLQRAGRAGRGGKIGYVFTLLSTDPIDAYYLRRPQEFFNREIIPLPLDITNVEVAKVHAAAYVLEKQRVQLSVFPEVYRKALVELEKDGIVKISGEYVYPTVKAREFVLKSSIRGIGPSIKIRDTSGQNLGERQLPEALYDLYPDAIYLISKRTYKVQKLDLQGLEVRVSRVNDDLSYYTKPLYEVNLLEFKPISNKEVYGMKAEYGEMLITVYITGYVIKDVYAKKEKDRGMVMYEEPISFSYWTKGIIIPHPSLPDFTIDDSMEAFHATEHVLISAGRVVAGASQTDLAGISYPSGHVIIYDSAIGGSGVAKQLFERLEDAYEVALDIVSKCDCEDGCPKCIYSPYCGNNNRVLSRKKSMRLIDFLIHSNKESNENERWGKPIV
ncbi:MAG: DEAD/DEAH box helicase [Sulfolobaceae archaeon]|nr:DEAD/DEAH box helicase [Sulfolobaceae archaeon]